MSGKPHYRGLALVLLGVLAFSLTFPAMRMALGQTPGQTGGFDPLVVGFGRTVLAAIVAALVITFSSHRVDGLRLPRNVRPGLALVALGNGLGFGALVAIALKSSTAAHGAIVTAALPIATAIIAVLRNQERPSAGFWAASLGGTVVVVLVTVAHSSGGLNPADLLLLVAVGIGGLGYAEGGRLTQQMPGILVASWSVLIAAPVAAVVTGVALLSTANTPDIRAWFGLAYVSFVSLYLAFFPFYRGLADVGVARASQIQLIQPLFTVVWSALLIGEVVGWRTFAAAALVLVFVVATQMTRVGAREVMGSAAEAR